MASTPRQLIDQATRHAVYLERYKTQAVSEYQTLLKRMERSAISALAGENITDWSRTRLNKELAAIRAAMREVGQDISGLMRRQSLALAEYEAGFEVRSLSKVGVNVDFTLPSDTQLRAAVFGRPLQAQGPYQGTLLESFFDEWPERAIARMDGAIRLGYARGRTTQQLVSDIYASGGAADMSRRSLSSVVRTGLAHSANEARQETWAANSDIIKAERIVATLDDRTSSECRSLDGQEFPLGKGPRPPFHISCRTTTVAVLDDRFAVLDEGGTRAARDPETGKVERVPAKETYYGWLKKQPESVQDSILGPTRGALLRDGGLSAQRFAELQVGRRFEPLTLRQMRRLEPVAFTRAGL